MMAGVRLDARILDIWQGRGSPGMHSFIGERVSNCGKAVLDQVSYGYTEVMNRYAFYSHGPEAFMPA